MERRSSDESMGTSGVVWSHAVIAANTIMKGWAMRKMISRIAERVGEILPDFGKFQLHIL